MYKIMMSLKCICYMLLCFCFILFLLLQKNRESDPFLSTIEKFRTARQKSRRNDHFNHTFHFLFLKILYKYPTNCKILLYHIFVNMYNSINQCTVCIILSFKSIERINKLVIQYNNALLFLPYPQLSYRYSLLHTYTKRKTGSNLPSQNIIFICSCVQNYSCKQK